MNPGVFKTVNRENIVSTDGDNNKSMEDLITEQFDSYIKQERYLNIIFDKKEYVIAINTILYITIKKNVAEIHTQGYNIYYARMSLKKLKEQLGDGFLLVHKNTLVAAKAIHEVSDNIYLSNGEALHYVGRKKKAMRNNLFKMQKDLSAALTRRMFQKHMKNTVAITEDLNIFPLPLPI